MARPKPDALSVAQAKLRLRNAIEQPHSAATGFLPLLVESTRRYPRYALVAGLAMGFLMGAVPTVRQSIFSKANHLLRRSL